MPRNATILQLYSVKILKWPTEPKSGDIFPADFVFERFESVIDYLGSLSELGYVGPE